MLPKFDDKNSLIREEGKRPFKTREGKAAVLDAIEFLKQAEPVRELRYNSELSLAAKFHVEDVGS